MPRLFFHIIEGKLTKLIPQRNLKVSDFLLEKEGCHVPCWHMHVIIRKNFSKLTLFTSKIQRWLKIWIIFASYSISFRIFELTMSHLGTMTRDRYFEQKLNRNWLVRILSHLKIISTSYAAYIPYLKFSFKAKKNLKNNHTYLVQTMPMIQISFKIVYYLKLKNCWVDIQQWIHFILITPSPSTHISNKCFSIAF